MKKKELFMENYSVTFWGCIIFSILALIFYLKSYDKLIGILVILGFISSAIVFMFIYKKNVMHNKMIECGIRIKAQIVDYSLCYVPIPYLKIKCQYFNKENSQLYFFEDKSYLNHLSGNLLNVIKKQNKIDVAYNPKNNDEYYIFIEEAVFVWNRSV